MQLVEPSLTGDEAIVVFGKKRAAIYNLALGEVLWLGEREHRILCEVKNLNYIPIKFKSFFGALEDFGVHKLTFEEKIPLQERQKRYPPRFEIINVEVTFGVQRTMYPLLWRLRWTPDGGNKRSRASRA